MLISPFGLIVEIALYALRGILRWLHIRGIEVSYY